MRRRWKYQAAGQLALQSQEKCLKQIRFYFATLPPYEDDATLQVCLQTLVPGINVAERSIAQMKGARAARTLHKKITHEPPATTSDWAEYGAASKVVDGFFKFSSPSPLMLTASVSASFLSSELRWRL